MGTFRKPALTLALLKLKLKYPSSSYSKRKAKYQRNADVDSEHVKRSAKCKRNGPNVTPYNAEHKAVSLTVSRKNKGPLCTLRQWRKQP